MGSHKYSSWIRQTLRHEACSGRSISPIAVSPSLPLLPPEEDEDALRALPPALALATSAPDPLSKKQQQFLGDGTPIPPDLSKNAYKKMLKKQSWEASKGERRSREKEKKREKRAAFRERQQEEKREGGPDSKQAEQQRRERKPFQARIVVDMGFDELMTDKEVSSMTSQLAFLYSSNRHSHAPFSQIILAGPSRASALKYCPDPSIASEVWCPHNTAKMDGFYPRLQDAIKAGETVEFNQSRIGKLMQANGNAQWRRWKHVAIVEKGGLEALWEGSTIERTRAHHAESVNLAQAEHGESHEEEDSLHREVPIDCKTEVEETLPGLSPDAKVSARRQERQLTSSLIHPSSIVPTNLDKKDIIYLTADTDETIEELEEGKTYVIGGIVDRNRFKHLCLNKAQELGLKVARLPIDISNLTKKSAEGKTLSSRKVLTVNQVFDILIGWTEQYQQQPREDEQAGTGNWKTPSWEEALDRGLPGRKFVQKESKHGKQEEEEDLSAPNGKDSSSEDSGEVKRTKLESVVD